MQRLQIVRNIAEMPNLEFIVDGTPASLQAKSATRRRWKTKVTKMATNAASHMPGQTTNHVQVTVVYFYESGSLDLDNILKPILDAMTNVIYEDDTQVVNIIANKRNLNERVTLRIPSIQLASKISKASNDFVWLKLDFANTGQLP